MSVNRRVFQHLLALGVRKQTALAFADKVDMWIAESGSEWTSDRLKTLRSAMVTMLATGKHYQVPLGWATRRNRSNEIVFKDKFIHAVFSEAKLNLRFAENALRVYQAIKLDTVSGNQLRKMEKAVAAPSNATEGFVEMWSNHIHLRETSANVRKRALKEALKSDPLTIMAASEKRSPSLEVGRDSVTIGKTVKRSSIDGRDVWTLLFRDSKTKSLWVRHPSDVSKCIIGQTTMPMIDTGEKEVDVPAGTLTALQEGGCKVRWIANPHLLYQSFGEPLKRKLQSITRSVFPEVRVDDQDSGREQVADWLREGKTVYCYDCSSFTDRFPLALQEAILQQLRERDIVSEFDWDAFRLVLDKSWYYRGNDKLMKWEVGQPLGYGPSFALATITHAALLDTLGCSGEWMVVGDDVVIANPELAEKYQFVMTSLGVEINQSKSVISPHLGEFLGKLITSSGVNPSMKVKSLETNDQVVKLIAFYGNQFIDLLDRKWWQAELVAYLPSWLGGLGMKPDGFSDSDIVSLLDKVAIQKSILQTEVGDFHGLSQWDSQGVKDWMELKQRLLQPYQYYLDLLGEAEVEHHFGKGVQVNSLGGLSATNGTLKRATPSSTVPTFVSLVDKLWFYEPQSLSPDSMRMFNTFGYIRAHEVPSSLDDSNTWISCNQTREKMSNDIQYQASIRFFKQPRKTWWRIQNGRS